MIRDQPYQVRIPPKSVVRLNQPKYDGTYSGTVYSVQTRQIQSQPTGGITNRHMHIFDDQSKNAIEDQHRQALNYHTKVMVRHPSRNMARGESLNVRRNQIWNQFVDQSRQMMSDLQRQTQRQHSLTDQPRSFFDDNFMRRIRNSSLPTIFTHNAPVNG